MNSFTFNGQEYVMIISGKEADRGEDYEVIITLELDDGKIIGTKVDEKDLFKFTFSEEPNRPDTFYSVTKEYHDNFTLNFAKSLLADLEDQEDQEDEEDEEDAKKSECKNLLTELEKRFDDLINFFVCHDSKITTTESNRLEAIKNHVSTIVRGFNK
jgi:hypothetical protein